jgi:hypothetical protein
MQVKGSVRQHAYLMIPQRSSGSARCGAPTGRLWPFHPKASRRLAGAIGAESLPLLMPLHLDADVVAVTAEGRNGPTARHESISAPLF